MTWEEAKVVLKNGDYIRQMDSGNYLFLYKPNHFIIYSSKKDSLYRIQPSDEKFSTVDWKIDNTIKEKIINKLRNL